MSSKVARQIRAEHIPDAAWIIALWKAIHGGDPSPEEVAKQAIVSLATYAAGESQSQLSVEELQRGLQRLGISVSVGQETMSEPKREMAISTGGSESGDNRPPYCFHWAGQTICIPRPKLTHVV